MTTTHEEKFIEVTPGEIKKGDYVRVQYEIDGLKVQLEGLAYRSGVGDLWVTEEGSYILPNILWKELYGTRLNEKIFIREEPMPDLPTEEGTIIRIKTVEDPYENGSFHDVNALARLDDDGDWVFFGMNTQLDEEYIHPSFIRRWNPVQITDLAHPKKEN